MSFTTTTIELQNTELPNAADITSIASKASLTNKIPEFDQQEQKQRELERTVYILNCVNYIFEYIKQIAPEKIYKRVKNQLNNCYIYRFSPPIARGYRTRYFSQIVYDTDTQKCRFEYFRPLRHARNLWYFPIYYMMNGFTNNPHRTFDKLSISSVEQLLTEYFTNKGYRISFFRNRIINERPTGNLIFVEWGPKSTTELQNKSNIIPLIEDDDENNEIVPKEHKVINHVVNTKPKTIVFKSLSIKGL